MMKAAKLWFLFLLITCVNAWATDWHLCPDTDSANTDINYGLEDGTSEANCFDGNTDAWATAGDIDAGDNVYLHGTFYHEKIVIGDSGTSGSPITIICGSDCLIWNSIDLSGNNTTANTTNAQTTGSSWQLVSGTTSLYKKGVGTVPYKLWVNGTYVPYATTVPATQDDAGAIAVTTPGTFTGTTEDLDGLSNTVYYNGSITTARANAQQQNALVANVFGALIVNGQNYITLQTPKVRGFHPNANEYGGIFIQGCTGCRVEDPYLYENGVGMKTITNTNLVVTGTDHDTCSISNNTGFGYGVSGAAILSPSGALNQVTGITRANPGVVTTSGAHGIASTAKVVIQSVSGMTQVNGNEYTATRTGANTFSIVDTSGFSAWTSGGIVNIQGTDTGTSVSGCAFDNNGNVPSFNGITINSNNDANGIGVGYLGGTFNSMMISRNRFWNNGPRQVLYSGASGDIDRGDGLIFSTTYTMAANSLKVTGNDFYNNHRYNLLMNDVDSALIAGNIFRGVVHYGATTTAYQSRYALSATTTDIDIYNNTFSGVSGRGAISIVNDAAGKLFDIRNNAFESLTLNAGTGSTTWLGAIVLSAATASVTEGYNSLYNLPSGLFWRNGTQYTTVSSWASATSQGTGDITTDPLFVGGLHPTHPKGFRLRHNSPLIGAGTCVLSVGCAPRDYLGRRHRVPPNIGAYATGQGDQN